MGDERKQSTTWTHFKLHCYFPTPCAGASWGILGMLRTKIISYNAMGHYIMHSTYVNIHLLHNITLLITCTISSMYHCAYSVVHIRREFISNVYDILNDISSYRCEVMMYWDLLDENIILFVSIDAMSLQVQNRPLKHAMPWTPRSYGCEHTISSTCDDVITLSIQLV